MVRLVSLYRRELLGLFVSPVAWIILFIFLLTNGATFTFYLFALDGDTSALLASQYGSLHWLGAAPSFSPAILSGRWNRSATGW